MGRSVSVASGAFAVAYQDCSNFGVVEEDGDGNKLEEIVYDEYQGQFDWNDFIANTKADLQDMFPSFVECDKWLDREDHAILENRFAYFGVSEYCGLVSLWLVLKDNLNGYYSDENLESLAENWANKVKDKFEKTFGTLRKVGAFSNGEAIYRRIGNEG